jgi:hypothetical protein
MTTIIPKKYRARRARRRKEAVAALDALKKEETP